MKKAFEKRLAMSVKTGASVVALMGAQAAFAQAQPQTQVQTLNQDTATPAPNTAPPAGEASPGTGDIIVTATKRSQRLQDVPISVVAITPTVLTQTGTVSTTQLPTLTPGLSFGQAGEPKLTSFYLRGVGTYALGPTLESSVGVAIDGVPIARVSGSIADMIDVDHIEVVKGPQGTLFGKNATAGLISIVNNKPRIGETSFTGHASYGSYNEANVDVAVNVGLGENGAFRATAWRAGHSGFTTDRFGNKYDNSNSYGGRVGVLVKPVDTLTLSLVGQFDGRDQRGSLLTLRQYSPTTPPPLIAYENSIGIVPSPGYRVGDFSQPSPFVFGKNMSITGTADLELGGGYTLSNITSFRDVYAASSYDTFATSAPFLAIPQLYQTDKYHQFTSELRLSSPTDKRLSYVVGLFYYDFHIRDFTQFQFVGVPTPGVSNFTRQAYLRDDLQDYAGFADVTLRIVPGLRVIGGIRQSHDDTGGGFERKATGVDTPPLPPLASVFAFTPNRVTYDFTSYRVGGQFDVAHDVMLYATYSRGYKAPGFNLASSLTLSQLVNNTNVSAETARSIEGGIKSQFFDRRLTINVTGFHSIFSNFQTTVSQPSVPGSFIIQNANELKSDGVEFELSARPVRALSLGLRGAYINARFTDYNNAQCYLNEPTLPAGSPLTPGFCVGGVQTLNGAQAPFSPKFSIGGNARYDMAFGSRWKGYVSGDANYRSTTLFEGKNDPNELQRGYTVTNFNVGFGPQDGRWTLSAYLRNAFQERFVARIRDQLNLYQQIDTFESLRRVGAQLEVKF